MRRVASRSPPRNIGSDDASGTGVTTKSINNPYISSVLRRSSQMSQGSGTNQRRSTGATKQTDPDLKEEEIEQAAQMIEEGTNKSMHGPNGRRGIAGNFTQKRGSAQAIRDLNQDQVKSTTGGLPDPYDDKSGSRHDDQTSNNTGLQLK